MKLDFPDESFDAVTSNYVYHNITGEDKQPLLLETLRVLKKGGVFAIHDLMSPRRCTAICRRLSKSSWTWAMSAWYAMMEHGRRPALWHRRKPDT